MRNTTRCLVVVMMMTLASCVLFDDLERSHPFPHDAGSETAPDSCDECPGECVDGECIVDDCSDCGPDAECIDGRCEPLCNRDDGCCETPDCDRVKLCLFGEQVTRDDICPCEESGECVCPDDQDECVPCDGADGCTCAEGSTCTDGTECVNGRCGGQPGVCHAGDPHPDCEPCADQSQCPDDTACIRDSGYCHPLLCVQSGNGYELCYFQCVDDETLCPGDRFCEGPVCRKQECECPSDATCGGEGQCLISGTEEPVSCDTDDVCAPGICVRNICMGV